MTQPPLHWIKTVEKTLIDTGAIPLSGYPPQFPWGPLQEELSKLFGASDITVALERECVLKGEALREGLGSRPIVLTLNLSPLLPSLFFLMGREEMIALTTLALSASGKGFLSAPLQEGFYYYLCTQIIAQLNEAHAFGDLFLKIGKTTEMPTEEALCLDLSLHLPQRTFLVRVLCPASFHSAFKAHFSNKPAGQISAIAGSIELCARLTCGEVTLTCEQWKQVGLGDVILLERCTFDPQSKKGTAILLLDEIPLLRVRLKEDHLKIVDYATYHEAIMEPPEEFDKEETFASEEETSGEEHLWTSEQEEGAAPSVSIESVSLTLTVEVAKVRLTLEKLLSLSPGNTLELPVKPEQGVAVMVGGKQVAKAELIKLGDHLGIKILSLGG